MRTHHYTLSAFLISATFCCHAQTSDISLQTDQDKALYTLGALLSDKLRDFELTDAEIAIVKAGIEDGARDRPRIDIPTMRAAMPILEQMQKTRTAAAAAREGASGTTALTQVAAEKGAVKLASGMVYRSLKEGTGATPQPTDTVEVRYQMKYSDGKVIDTTDSKGPVSIQLNNAVACFSEGLQKMKVGGRSLLACPPELLYGTDGPRKDLRANASVIAEVEILGIVKSE